MGVLQIQVFEGKISSGTAIASTTRDAALAAESFDFARLCSHFHSAAGFYLIQACIVGSFFLGLYYLAALSLSGLDAAILASEGVYLLGEVSGLQWWMQLGLSAMVPLFALSALQAGLLAALANTARITAAAGPLFFMFEIQTKAYFFDHALAFGRSA